MGPLDFLRVAVRDYKRVGAVTVSSKYAVNRVVEGLGRNCKYVVEYGAGNGVIAREILKVLPPDGKLVAIELNPKLFRELSKIKDNRLLVLNQNVVEAIANLVPHCLPRIDAIVSGIPFSFMNLRTRADIVAKTHLFLSAGGRFILYQTTPALVPILRLYFTRVKKNIELRNLPPYFVIVAEK